MDEKDDVQELKEQKSPEALETTEESQQGGSVAATVTRTRAGKVLSVVKKVVLGILIAIIAFLIVVAAILCWDKFVNKSPAPSVFGYSGLVVTTGSMSGTIEEGDLVIIKNTGDYKIGDIVTYIGENETTPTTHRIVNYDGDKFVTKGDANNVDDLVHITDDMILGEVVTTIPHVGLFFSWLTAESGWVYLVAVVAIIALGIVLIKYSIK